MSAPKFTATQSLVLTEIRKGAGTDAEIGETLTTMKLSAIGTSVRSLVKRGIVVVDTDGRYVSADQHEAAHGEEDHGDTVVEVDGVKVAETKRVDIAPAEETHPEATTDDLAPSDLAHQRGLALQGDKAERTFTKDPRWVRCITVAPATYVTVDGLFAVAKVGDEPKTPWVLFKVAKKGLVRKASFRTSSDALLVENLDAIR